MAPRVRPRLPLGPVLTNFVPVPAAPGTPLDSLHTIEGTVHLTGKASPQTKQPNSPSNHMQEQRTE